MKQRFLKIEFWIVAAVLVGMAGRSARAAELSGATNEVAIDDLAAEITRSNPELGFYRAEIAAAKGERRTAGTLANPELSGALGGKRVEGASLAGEGGGWSLSMRQPC